MIKESGIEGEENDELSGESGFRTNGEPAGDAAVNDQVTSFASL